MKFAYGNNSLQLPQKICSDICPRTLALPKRNSFPRAQFEVRSRKTVNFEEQIMSKDKYPSIFCAKWRLLCLLSFKYF